MGDADATNSNYSIVYFVGYVWLYYTNLPIIYQLVDLVHSVWECSPNMGIIWMNCRDQPETRPFTK